MTRYTIFQRVRQTGFKVEVIGQDGSRNTMLGFDTKEEASDWVAASQRRDAISPAGDGS